ncbi:MAG: hypothetical protein IPG39_16495 [Bacteroidetes bacterium]|nr:hypothetical protein [Bacteroidota bacterium]
MLTETSKFIIIVFGLFFIGCGGLMLLNPVKAREILRKAGSTNFINYAEITLRMVPAISLIIYSDYSEYPELFKVFGWFMLVTSLILYFVPRKLHHDFSNKCADVLKPLYFRLIAPFSILIGILIINSVM